MTSGIAAIKPRKRSAKGNWIEEYAGDARNMVAATAAATTRTVALINSTTQIHAHEKLPYLSKSSSGTEL